MVAVGMGVHVAVGTGVDVDTGSHVGVGRTVELLSGVAVGVGWSVGSGVAVTVGTGVEVGGGTVTGTSAEPNTVWPCQAALAVMWTACVIRIAAVFSRSVATPELSVIPVAGITPASNAAVACTCAPGTTWFPGERTVTITQIGSGAVTDAAEARTEMTGSPNVATGVAGGAVGLFLGVRGVAVALATGDATDVTVPSGAATMRKDDTTGSTRLRVEIVADTATDVPPRLAEGWSTTEVAPRRSVRFI